MRAERECGPGSAIRRVVAALRRVGCSEYRPGLWNCPTCDGWLAVTQGEGRVYLNCLGAGDPDAFVLPPKDLGKGIA